MTAFPYIRRFSAFLDLNLPYDLTKLQAIHTAGTGFITTVKIKGNTIVHYHCIIKNFNSQVGFRTTIIQYK